MEDKIEWDKTVLVQERLKNNSFYEESSPEGRYGMWQGRPIIGRDSLINGGVYLGGGEREAIVVDDKKQPELTSIYQELLRRREAKEKHGEPFKFGVLKEVFDITREKLPYNQTVVYDLTENLLPDQKIALSVFIKNRGGECRHQALLAAYLLEKLRIDNYVNGKVSVDRNYVEGMGGHAWVRYINSANDVYIIDPAQNFIGKIEDTGSDQWFYERPSSFTQKIKRFFIK
ncbi:hypothetical protein A2W13_00295 [Candidatus Woesebacteria bacterium RBG_16_36_11]|uniref:Transglutaminase-like domain-containing protein n=1 Tax=Candidatus Woesebacteria bacterium RBG_16_36_11 TaxID=1802481 RepID=A0A1F7X984_9BACT|nr:MAG: hypothetical protein A2W13_00295 [Candidatus Woesebacteria bacterium RBG_16_36_11]